MTTGVIIAADDLSRVGHPIVDRRGLPDIVSQPMMTSPVEDGQISYDSFVAAPIKFESNQLGVALCRVDTSQLVSILHDTSSLGKLSRTAIANLSRAKEREKYFPYWDGQLPQSGFETVPSDDGSNLIYWEPIAFCSGVDTRHSFVVTLPTREAFSPLDRLRSSLVLVIIVVTAINALIAFLSARRTERRLKRLVDEISQNDFSEPLDVSSNDDFGFLASAFNDMSREVTSQMAALREGAEREHDQYSRLAHEIRIAQQIQECLYPAEPLLTPELEVTGRSVAAENLCGDYFDYFEVGDEIIFALGDVSGHGIGPALLMVEVRGAVRGLRWDSISLVDVVSRLNMLLVTGTTAGRFVTLMIGRIHRESGELEYVGAGHRGFVVRKTGEVDELASTGIVLGLVPDAKYSVRRTLISIDDIVLANSDGIEETANTSGVLFGRKRMLEVVAQHREKQLSEIIDSLFSETHQHSGDKRNADDCTVMMLRPALGRIRPSIFRTTLLLADAVERRLVRDEQFVVCCDRGGVNAVAHVVFVFWLVRFRVEVKHEDVAVFRCRCKRVRQRSAGCPKRPSACRRCSDVYRFERRCSGTSR